MWCIRHLHLPKCIHTYTVHRKRSRRSGIFPPYFPGGSCRQLPCPALPLSYCCCSAIQGIPRLLPSWYVPARHAHYPSMVQVPRRCPSSDRRSRGACRTCGGAGEGERRLLGQVPLDPTTHACWGLIKGRFPGTQHAPTNCQNVARAGGAVRGGGWPGGPLEVAWRARGCGGPGGGSCGRPGGRSGAGGGRSGAAPSGT